MQLLPSCDCKTVLVSIDYGTCTAGYLKSVNSVGLVSWLQVESRASGAEF